MRTFVAVGVSVGDHVGVCETERERERGRERFKLISLTLTDHNSLCAN